MIGFLYYGTLVISVLLAVWGISKKLANNMYLSALLCFLCALAGMWSIGFYLVPLAFVMLVIGVYFSYRKKAGGSS